MWAKAQEALRHRDPPEVREAQHKTLLLRSKVLSAVALAVIPFTIIAYNSAFFPEQRSQGALIALIADGAVLILLGALMRGWFDRMPALAFGLLLGVICNVTELAQLHITGGPTDSTFFFPYYLVFFGIATFFPARFTEVLVTCVALPIGYVVLGILTGADFGAQRFVSNVILLVDYAFLAVIANRLVTTIFLREVRLRLDLELANERLRELDRLKNELFANVSHELRTPLTLLLGPVQSLLSGDPGPLSDGQRALLVGVRRNATRLLALINDLLLLAKLEAGETTLQRDPVELGQLVRRVADAVGPHASSLGLTLAVEVPEDELIWLGDVRHADRILMNLLSNACKFSREGGTVTVSLSRNGDELCLSVADEGVGIAATDLKRLFQRFVQIESGSNRRFEGTGIGLAIVRQLVTLYGGRATVESELGRGSTFAVHLPIDTDHVPHSVRDEAPRLSTEDVAARLPAAASRVAPEAVAKSGRARILVVEDNADLRAYLEQELARGYDVLAFGDSSLALERAASLAPDLVLSDVMMPILDGIELARQLRAADATRDVPVLLMSARDDVDTKLAGFAVGVDDYVAKPFQLPELRARIDVHLRLRAQTRELATSAEELRDAMKRLKDSEAVLLQQEKMATLGTVVAGVAHELNNPLHFLRGNQKLLRRQLAALDGDARGKSEAILVDMDASIERLGYVCSELLRFGRHDRGGKDDVKVREVVDLAARMINVGSGERVRIKNLLGDEELAHANAQDLFQITLNLMMNAVQSLGERGGEVRIEGRHDNGRLEVRISDDGCGISEADLGRVFEPFFTTKPPGQGTGLGLAIVQKLAAEQEGSISLASEEGKGTVASLVLPTPIGSGA